MKDNIYQNQILSPDSLDDLDHLYSDISASEPSAEIREIRKYSEENNRLLNQIEQHTMVMTIIMTISLACSAISVAAALIIALNLNSL